MADVAARFLAGLQAGQQIKQQQQAQLDAADDRKMRKMLHELELRKLKIEEHAAARGLSLENFKLQEGRPQAELPTEGGILRSQSYAGVASAPMGQPGQTVLSPTAQAPVQNAGVQIPGIEELGVSGMTLRPQSMEDLIRAQVAAKQRDIALTPQKVGPGERVMLGGQTIAEGGPRPTSLQSVNRLANGRPTTLNFNPQTGAYTDQAGQPVANVQPIPPASVTAANTPAPEILAGSREFKVAQDLAYGKLTFQMFRGLYAYSRDANKRLAIYQKASELNPGFNPAQFEMGYRFAANPQTQRALASVDNVLPNIDKIIDVSQSLPRTDLPTVNRFLLGAQFQLGNAKVSSFRQMQKLLGDEIGAALGAGTMTDMKLKLGLDVVDPNLSPEQFFTNMERVRDFLNNRKRSLLNQMGVYGTPEMNPGARPVPGATSPGADLTAPAISGASDAYQLYLQQQGGRP